MPRRTSKRKSPKEIQKTLEDFFQPQFLLFILLFLFLSLGANSQPIKFVREKTGGLLLRQTEKINADVSRAYLGFNVRNENYREIARKNVLRAWREVADAFKEAPDILVSVWEENRAFWTGILAEVGFQIKRDYEIVKEKTKEVLYESSASVLNSLESQFESFLECKREGLR